MGSTHHNEQSKDEAENVRLDTTTTHPTTSKDESLYKPSRKDGKLGDLSSLTAHFQCIVCRETTECQCWDKRVDYGNIDSIYLGPLELHVDTPADVAGRSARKRAKKDSAHPSFTPPTPEERVHQSIHVAGEHNRISSCNKSTTMVMMGLGRDRQWCVDVPLSNNKDSKRTTSLPMLHGRIERDLSKMKSCSPDSQSSTDGADYSNPFVLEEQPCDVSARQREEFTKAKNKHNYWLVLSQRSVGEMLQELRLTDALFVYYSMIKQIIEMHNIHFDTFGVEGKDGQLVASVLFDIGNIYALNREYDEAFLFYKKSLDFLTRSQHVQHLDALCVHSKCGMMAYAAEDFDAAEHHFSSALDGLRDRLVGGNDLALSKLYNNLACVQFEKNDTVAALMWWRKSLDLGATTLIDYSDKDDRSSFSTALSLSNLCVVYYKDQELEEAASAAEQALSLQREYLTADSFTLRASYSSLALAAKLSGDHEVCSSVYKELYELQRDALGPNNRGTLRTLELFSESVTLLPRSVQANILQKGRGARSEKASSAQALEAMKIARNLLPTHLSHGEGRCHE